NNIINFYYSISNINEHHIHINKILKEEILYFGEDNIYDIINRTLQLDGYNSQNSLFISIIFPIYMKIKDLIYDRDILSGKILFHEIFERTKLFFKLYSNPNYNEKSLKGTEEIVILKEDSHPIKTNKRIFELKFSLDLKKYNCDPIFKIRALWEKLPNLFLIDFQKTLRIPLFKKSYEDLREEVAEENNYINELPSYQKSIPNYEKNFIKPDVKDALLQLKPNIFANGGDRKNEDDLPEAPLCRRMGVEMVFRVGGKKIRSSSGMLVSYCNAVIRKNG
ncbi:hypothetical protein LCGC14_3072670, partial [marine sediment metagenome]